MKHKILITILLIVCVAACVFGLAACDGILPTTPSTTHTHNYQWVNNGDGTHKQHCQNTGCDAPDINSGEHTWGANDKCDKCNAGKPVAGHTHDYLWVDNGDGTHKQHCQNDGCNEPDINDGEHTWNSNDKCEKCNASKPVAQHTHNYQWVNNFDETHEQRCRNEGCDAPVINAGEHTYVGGICDKCHGIAAPEGHTHDYQWQNDGTNAHSLHCQNEGCNYQNPLSSTEAHVWGANGICDKCRAVNSSLHKHNLSTEYYCRGDLDHMQTCDSCNFAKSAEHDYVNNVCSLCGHVKTSGSFTFTLNEDGNGYSVKLDKRLASNYPDIVIPCTYFGEPVTAIEAEGFKDSKITSVVILGCCIAGDKNMSGITSIGANAFAGCTKLKSIVIPKTVTQIGASAFEGCTAVTDVTVPFVGANADARGDNANFGYIFGAPSYRGSSSYIPSTLKNVVVTGGNYIEHHAFRGCTGTTNITLPEGLTTIGEQAFPSQLTSINIPSTVTAIGANAFKASKITSIALPDGMQTIETSLFENCSELTEITIGKGIKSIATNAFNNCEKLRTVKYTGDLAGWCGGISGLDELMQSNPALYINQQLLSGEVAIPDSVSKISGSAFRGYNEITEIKIHDGVTDIGANAFGGCGKLKRITVDENNATYASQDGILYNKAKTKCILIPSDIEGEITVPNGITRISFNNCPKVTTVNLPSSIQQFSFIGCEGLTSIAIPDGVTSIEPDAFMGCTALANVTIPDSVTNIGSNTFVDTAWYNNQQNGLVYAGKVAYKYKGAMPNNFNVILKAGTVGIADNAFANCTGLSSIELPDSVTNIGSWAFAGCEKLIHISYNGTKAQWELISKTLNWDYNLPASCFISCTDGAITRN